MRLVAAQDAFAAALAGARSEAQAAFGSATVLLERAIVEPRHVEIQVFADDHGNVVHLGERDCSVQRRHQKVIEEAPSPALAGDDGPDLRRRMGAMAVAAARAIGYRGAGTIECLLDADQEFHFMEMNTRLQVEHPVTEALTGHDLVEWQIRVARGEALPETSQEAILRRFEGGGHAIEVRLCAEDPARDFLPQSGTLLRWAPGAGVRVDHALADGAAIPPFYDSMVAKFVSHSPDRAAARRQLVEALRGTVALGVRTNQDFLAAALDAREFAQGHATTGFVARYLADVPASAPLRPALAAALAYGARAWRHGHHPGEVVLPMAWAVHLKLAVDGAEAVVAVQPLGGNRYRIGEADSCEEVRVLEWAGDRARLEDAAGRIDFMLAAVGERLYAGSRGVQSVIDDLTLAPASLGGAAAAGQVRAPMAGRIVSVLVSPGERVEKGATLAVLEAMKMEHPAAAPMAAVVQAVLVEQGAQVAAGSLLIELAPAP
jgi:geranyl-CoA carboxylase alpha subunit